MPHVQGLGQGASFIREDGVATTAFLLYLFSPNTDALQFLKDLRLITSNAYNQKTNYIYSLSEDMFASLCAARAIDPFTMFLDVITRGLVAPACARITALSTLMLLLLFPYPLPHIAV
jgi:hypothetical protein